RGPEIAVRRAANRQLSRLEIGNLGAREADAQTCDPRAARRDAHALIAELDFGRGVAHHLPILVTTQHRILDLRARHELDLAAAKRKRARRPLVDELGGKRPSRDERLLEPLLGARRQQTYRDILAGGRYVQICALSREIEHGRTAVAGRERAEARDGATIF